MLKVILLALSVSLGAAVVYDRLPDPAQNRCRKMRNTDTGEVIMSDGEHWYKLDKPL